MYENQTQRENLRSTQEKKNKNKTERDSLPKIKGKLNTSFL